MLVNALSYGIIIPLLYPYASRFGINPLGLSFLFASFSLAQLIATPIIGRLSDKYGRKPLLLICLAGSSISLALLATASNAFLFFIARIIDGVTGGNISVAQAVIADSTEGHERANAFGLLGAAFGFGFLVGPAIGGLLSEISLSTPFWFASALAAIGTLLGVVMLKETLKEKNKQVEKKRNSIFDIKSISHAFTNPLTGMTLLVSFIFLIALNAWIIGFQTFSNDTLKLSARDIGLMFATFGFISIVMQGFGIRILMKKIKHKKTILVWSLLLSALTVFPITLIHSFVPFFIMVLLYGIASSPITPVITALLSERTKAEDQGAILGINQSITSFAQIIGPILAGLIAVYSVNLVFFVAAVIITISLVATKWLYTPNVKPVDL